MELRKLVVGKMKNEKYLALRQNYNINMKNSKRCSVNIIVKIKTIHGGHLFTKLKYKYEKFEAAFSQHNCENKNDPWWTFIYYYSPIYRQVLFVLLS